MCREEQSSHFTTTLHHISMTDSVVEITLQLAKDLHFNKWYAMSRKQRTLLMKLITELQERADTPVAENTHYIRCPWSDPSCVCGPDTCYCSRTPSIIRKVKQLKSNLKNIA